MPKHPKHTPRLILYGLIAILLLTALLNVVGLSRQGLVHDDTAYFQGARTTLMVINWLHEHKPVSLTVYAAQHGLDQPVSPIWAKPVWHITTVALLAIFGDHDIALLFFNAFLGILLVWLLYRFMTDKFKIAPVHAILSLFFITTLGVFLILRRSGMAEVLAMFFFVSGMYIAFPDKRKTFSELFGGAALLALSFFTHPMFIPYAGAFFLFTQCVDTRTWNWGRIRSIFTQGCVYLFAFLCVFLVLDIPFLAIKHQLSPADKMYFQSHQEVAFPDIAEQLYDHFFCCSVNVATGEMGETQVKQNDMTRAGDSGMKKIPESFATRFVHEYGYDFFIMNGIVIMLLLPFLILGVLMDRGKKAWARYLPSTRPAWIILMCLLPMVFYSIPPMIPGNRNLFPAEVMILLFSGEFLWRWSKKLIYPWLKVSLLLLVVGYQLFTILPVFSAKSGLRETAFWLQQHGQRTVYIFNVPTLMNATYILNSYNIKVNVINNGQALPRHGYLMVRLRNSYFISPEDNSLYRTAVGIARSTRPAFTTQEIPHLHALDLAKRAHSPLLDRLFQLVLKKNIKRERLPILLFDLRTVQR